MLLLLTGPRHSGKTTAAALLACRLHRRGHPVEGILAPARYRQGAPVGFDLVRISTGERVPFASRSRPGKPFTFSREGLDFGRSILADCRRRACPESFAIVDEYGPLELEGGGWRGEVDRLAGQDRGQVLLVVRHSLVTRVAALYG